MSEKRHKRHQGDDGDANRHGGRTVSSIVLTAHGSSEAKALREQTMIPRDRFKQHLDFGYE